MSKIILATLLGVFSAGAYGQTSTPSLASFVGMSGCWERRDDAKKLLVSEQWMKPAGTSMLGMGRTVRNGKTVDFEYMRIEERPDGIFFVARPSANKEETSFKLKTFTPSEVVFENPDHDFPQRVIYKATPLTLTGRIEGVQNGKLAAIDFPMNSVSCDSPAILK